MNESDAGPGFYILGNLYFIWDLYLSHRLPIIFVITPKPINCQVLCFRFIEAKRKEVDNASTASSMKIIDPISKDKSPPRTLNTSTGTRCCTRDPNISKCIDSGSFGSHSSGPVVKLPVETKVIMRCENQGSRQMTVRVHREQDKDTMNKIDAVSIHAMYQ